MTSGDVSSPGSSPYDGAFFEEQAPGSARSAEIALDLLFRHATPRSVVDVGCGVGTWLATAAAMGVADILGLDGDYVARDRLLIPQAAFVPIRLGEEPIAGRLGDRRFDLALCLEVAEHLPHASGPDLVADLVRLADLVLFSAAVPFQDGTGHVNEQWPEYWACLFRDQGYDCFDLLRPALAAAPDVAWWYAQNALVFARRGSEAAARLPASTLRNGLALASVHPQNLLRQVLWNFRTHRMAAREREEQDHEACLTAWLQGLPLPPLRAPQADDGLFPATRLDLGDPEAEIADLHRRLDDAVQGREIARHAAGRALAEGSLREALLRLQGAQARAAALSERLEEHASRSAGEAERHAQAQARVQAEAQAHAQALGRRAEQAEAAVAAMRRSTSWRLTAPWRALGRRLRGRGAGGPAA